MLTAKEVAKSLSNRSFEIASYLLPGGRKEGREYCLGNINGDSGKSLKICIEGEKVGVWSDFATGEGGDLLDLWSKTRNVSLYEAIIQACNYLGVNKKNLSGKKYEDFNRPNPLNTPITNYSSPVMKYLQEERHLTRETIEHFKVFDYKGSIAFPSFRNDALISIKYLKLERIDGKKIMYTEKNCRPCLFGWQSVPKNSRKLVICEGEIDAMTISQYGFPAVALPLGGGSGKKHQWIEYEFELLSIFDEIFLCMDNDEEGKKAEKELLNRLGCHRCRLVQLPFKDANECLKKGISKKEIEYIFENAISIDPVELKCASEATKKIQEWLNPEAIKQEGYFSPFSRAYDKIFFRPYEFSVWTGINGHGKSQFLGQIILDMMNQGARVCLASLEMRPEIFLGRLVKQSSGMGSPSNEYIAAIVDWFNDKLWYIDVLGKIDIRHLIEIFTYGLRKYGIDVFVIDSFMMLSGIYDDDFKSQKMCIEEICTFKNQNKCQVHMIVHPRKGVDEKSMPGKLDAKGSGSITDAADNCFTIWRNKEKEEIFEYYNKGFSLTERQQRILDMPDSVFRCDKQRNGSWEGQIGLWYDKNTFQYLEGKGKKPVRYVNYSCMNK